MPSRDRSPRHRSLPSQPTREDLDEAASRLATGLAAEETRPSPRTPEEAFEERRDDGTGKTPEVTPTVGKSGFEKKSMPRNEPEEATAKSEEEQGMMSAAPLVEISEAATSGRNYVVTRAGTHFHRATCQHARSIRGRSRRVQKSSCARIAHSWYPMDSRDFSFVFKRTPCVWIWAAQESAGYGVHPECHPALHDLLSLGQLADGLKL